MEKKEQRKRSGAEYTSAKKAKKAKKSMDMDLDLEDDLVAAPKGKGSKSQSLTAILGISIGNYTLVATDSGVTVDYMYGEGQDRKEFLRIFHDFGNKTIKLSPSYMLCQTGPLEDFDLIRSKFPFPEFRDWIVGKTTDQVVARVTEHVNEILEPLRVDLMPFDNQLELTFVGTTNTTHGVYRIEIPQDKDNKATQDNRIRYKSHKCKSGCWTNGSARSYLEKYMDDHPIAKHLGSHYELEIYGKNCMVDAIKKDKVNCGGNIKITCYRRCRNGVVKRYVSEFENMNTRDDPNYKLVSRKMKIIKFD